MRTKAPLAEELTPITTEKKQLAQRHRLRWRKAKSCTTKAEAIEAQQLNDHVNRSKKKLYAPPAMPEKNTDYSGNAAKVPEKFGLLWASETICSTVTKLSRPLAYVEIAQFY